MAIFNLNQINSQYNALTGKKKLYPYTAVMTGRAANAQATRREELNADLAQKDLDLQAQGLTQAADQFNKQQAVTADQFNKQLAAATKESDVSLKQTADQFNKQLQQQADIAQKQAGASETSTAIGGAQTLATTAYLADKAGLIDLSKAGEWIGLKTPAYTQTPPSKTPAFDWSTVQKPDPTPTAPPATGGVIPVQANTFRELSAVENNIQGGPVAGETVTEVVNPAISLAEQTTSPPLRSLVPSEQIGSLPDAAPLSGTLASPEVGAASALAGEVSGGGSPGLSGTYEILEAPGVTTGYVTPGSLADVATSTAGGIAGGVAGGVLGGIAGDKGILPGMTSEFGSVAGSTLALAALSSNPYTAVVPLAVKTVEAAVPIAEKTGQQIAEQVPNIIQQAGDQISSFFSGFCFLAGTPVEMENGLSAPVENVKLGHRTKKGGAITGRGEQLSSNLFLYDGVYVTGSHAVREDGTWVRVEDTPRAIAIPLDKPVVVYILNNEKHLLIISGITFADFSEIDGGECMTPAERIINMNKRDEEG